MTYYYDYLIFTENQFNVTTSVALRLAPWAPDEVDPGSISGRLNLRKELF